MLAAVALACAGGCDSSSAPSSSATGPTTAPNDTASRPTESQRRGLPPAATPVRGLPRRGTARLGLVEIRGGTTRALLALSGEDAVRLLPRAVAPDGVRSLALSPDGNRLALATAGGAISNELRVLDLRDRTVRTLSGSLRRSPAAFFDSVAWAPDGDRLAVTRGPGLYGASIEVLDATSGALQHAYRVKARLDSALTWTADGRRVVFARQSAPGPARLRSLDLASGRTATADVQHGLDPALGPDGKLALVGRAGVFVRTRATERSVPRTRPGDRYPRWLPDGRRLIVERASPSCPRSYPGPKLCSHVVILSLDDKPARDIAGRPARSPTAP